MPSTKRPKPLYRRGKYALYPRAGRNLEIVWYDPARKRERSISAGTRDPEQGRLALDRHYLADEGARHCPTCGRPWEAQGSPLLATIIADDLILAEGKAGERSIRTRLGHVARYLAAQEPTLTVAGADEAFAARFRAWMLAETISGGQRGGAPRPRAIGAVEGCLLQLAAAINRLPGQRARFRPQQLIRVARSPVYRADVATLAAMFNYCLRPSGKSIEHHFAPGQPNETLRRQRIGERANLLAYLRAAVATWARPDAIFDIHSRQWHAAARVLDLNPPHRRQTNKHRPMIPIARQFAPFLDDLEGALLPVSTIRAAWDRMARELGLPEGGEAGPKLIRRSMATLARKRLGEAQWRQGEMMLGHVRPAISDVYALPDPANLGLALKATEDIIDEIEALAPGAYNRTFTATAGKLAAVK